MSNRSVEKTRNRLKKLIEDGSHYEAHQQLRVLCQRYLKQENYPAAVDIVFTGATSLLKAGQSGSGGDLCLLLLSVYRDGGVKPTSESKGRIYQLLNLLPTEEPTRKRFLNEAVVWSAKNGEYPNGDPDLHHFIGNLLAGEDEAYAAEKHLLLGTKESAEVLGQLLYRWYAADDAFKVGHYAARAVLPYLLLNNVRDANKVLDIFSSNLTESNKNLTNSLVESMTSEIRVFPSLPLFNFLRLLVLTVERGQADTFRNLRSHYASHLNDVPDWNEALDQIGEIYFDIQIRRQQNLLDMMGSMFGGGGPAQPSGRPRLQAAAPSSAELD